MLGRFMIGSQSQAVQGVALRINVVYDHTKLALHYKGNKNRKKKEM